MKKVKITACVCTLALFVSMFSGCSSSKTAKTSSSSDEPVKLSIIIPNSARIIKADTENPPLKQLEKNTNTKLDISVVDDYASKYTVLASSGNIPDITNFFGFGFQTYADQDLFMDIGSLIDKNCPNLKKYISQDDWDATKYKGKTLAVPFVNTAGKYTTNFRQDWLDNLGLEMPKTLDEYEKILKAFTFDDPDKDGKNDTYGFGACGSWTDSVFGCDFQPIFGAFGIEPNMSYLKDSKIYNVMISDQYRQAITYIKSLWDEKVIDPELFTIKSDQAMQKIVNSKSGTVTGWWSTIPEGAYQQQKMDQVNANAKWTPVTTAITDNTGANGGYVNCGSIGDTTCISANCKNPVAALKFLDYLITDDGWLLSKKGIKGEDWTEFGAALTEQGQKAFNEKWLDPLTFLVDRLDLLNKWDECSTDPVRKEDNVYIKAAANLTLIKDFFYGLPTTDEAETYETDLGKYQISSFVNFVTGNTPLTDESWNSYVDTWKNARSGQKVFESKIKEYNELHSTKYTAGN